MIKPGSLNQYLLNSVPELATNPDQLQVFIDAGRLQANLKNSLSFEYQYTLNLIFTDLAIHPGKVLVPILAWLRTHQPDAPDDSVTFEADVLRKDMIDLSVRIPLTERVLVRSTTTGMTISHLEEPKFEYALPDPALFKALFADDTTDPAGFINMTQRANHE